MILFCLKNNETQTLPVFLNNKTYVFEMFFLMNFK